MTRILTLASLALLGVTTSIAVAQTAVPPVARPGHEPGVGTSLPLSGNASNINGADTKQAIAPTLPDVGLGDDAKPSDYLRAARAALLAKHTGQAQQALEMAETRALDRVVDADRIGEPNRGEAVREISDAREALGRGDQADAIRLIDVALARK